MDSEPGVGSRETARLVASQPEVMRTNPEWEPTARRRASTLFSKSLRSRLRIIRSKVAGKGSSAMVFALGYLENCKVDLILAESWLSLLNQI